MATSRVERRLAAILAADVAGYSRLMGVDEEGTIEALKAHRRELITPKLALAGVQPTADLEVERTDRFADGPRTTDRPRRAVERRQKANALNRCAIAR